MLQVRQQPGWLQLGDLAMTFVFPLFVEETDEVQSAQETRSSKT